MSLTMNFLLITFKSISHALYEDFKAFLSASKLSKTKLTMHNIKKLALSNHFV